MTPPLLPSAGEVWRENLPRSQKRLVLVLRVDPLISEQSKIPSLVYTPLGGDVGPLLYGVGRFSEDFVYVGRAAVVVADGDHVLLWKDAP